MFINSQILEEHAPTLKSIFKDIDDKLHQFGNKEYKRVAFGIGNDSFHSSFQDLIIYKNILQQMMYCTDCFCEYNIKTIISRIKNIINGC